MDAIETETVERAGSTYRITFYPDSHAANPLEDGDEMGTIVSLNRRHANFDPDGVDQAIRHNPDAVPLSDFEHGQCRWSVVGEPPPGARCPWDSVPFAGVWLPDAATLESARRYEGSARRHFLRQRAREACAVYTQWCNGDIYGYEVARLTACPCCGQEQSQVVDACWGFYGLEECRKYAEAALPASSPSS